MKLLLTRILRNGAIVAITLAIFGSMMASVAGVWLAGQPAMSRSTDAPGNATDLAADLRIRIPLALAAWGFGLVTAFELLLYLVRGNPKPAATATSPAATAPGSDAEVDALYNKLLTDSEATTPRPEPRS